MSQSELFLNEKSEDLNSSKRLSRNSLSDVEAASVIQRAWRKFIVIFKFKVLVLHLINYS